MAGLSTVPRYVLLLPILLLCWLSLTAVQWGIADIRIHFARDMFEQWAQQTTAPSHDDWSRVEATLLKAQELTASDHPDVKELLGKAYILKSGMTASDIRKSLLKALQYYQQAVELRPVSPYPWATIAIINDALGRHDESFDKALLNATYYGRWNPDVLTMMTELSFSTYLTTMSTVAKAELEASVDRAVRVQGAKVVHLAKKYVVLSSLCLKYRELKSFEKACH
ncbi:MAG: hypothetical protein JKY42_00285 [Flavobacteriales bacterium]|nr:hypothetical protein [Flavobacteriales bacterium]